MTLAIMLASTVPGFAANGVDDNKQQTTVETPPTADQALERFTVNMKEVVADVYIGNKQELREALEVLYKSGNKVVYLKGDAGSGKTAIAEQLAKMIDGTMYRLDLNAIEAGTGIRGTQEARMAALLKAFENRPDRILFVDEFHQIMRNPDLVNIFKPLMARGQLSVIAGTTFDEFRMFVEKDSALVSRGVEITVKTPSETDVLNVLREIRGGLEAEHQIRISDGILRLVAKITKRYFASEPAFRKAKDLLDRAMVREKLNARLGNFDDLKLQDEVERLQLELKSLEADKANGFAVDEDRVQELKDKIGSTNEVLDQSKARIELAAMERKAAQAAASSDFQLANQIKMVDIPRLKAKYGGLLTATATTGVLTETEFLRFLQTQTGIPADISGADAAKQSKNIVETINKYVRGEEGAAQQVGDADLIRSQNVEEAKGPRNIILLAGSPGNGKSEFAKAVTIGQYGTADKLIRIDVAKMNSVWGVSGSESGYQDSDRSSLIEPLRRDPNHNVLFDELDKNRVLDGFLLPVLEEGKSPDGLGRMVHYTQASIILTANWGEAYSLNKDVWSDSEAEQRYGLRPGELAGKTGAEKDTAIIEADMRRNGVSQALISRIPVKILMKKKTLAQVEDIARAQLEEQRRYLVDEKGIFVTFDESIVKFLARQSYDPSKGMRPLRWNRRAYISGILAATFGENALRKGDAITLKFITNPDGLAGKIAVVKGDQELRTKEVVLKVLVDPAAAAARSVVDTQTKPLDLKDPKAVDDAMNRILETISKKGPRK